MGILAPNRKVARNQSKAESSPRREVFKVLGLLALVLVFALLFREVPPATQSGAPAPSEAVAQAMRRLGPQRGSPVGPAIDVSDYDLKPLYMNDFIQPQTISREEDFIAKQLDGTWIRTGRPDPSAEWIAEGWGGVEIRNGQLRVAPYPFDAEGIPKSHEPGAVLSHMVIWNKQVFPENFLLEFDMSPGKSDSGLAMLLFSAAGKDGVDMFDLSLPPRRAIYATYYDGPLLNYTDAYWARNTEPAGYSNRLRKNPGLREVAQGQSFTGGPVEHVSLTRSGNNFAITVNGKKMLQWDNPDQHPGTENMARDVNASAGPPPVYHLRYLKIGPHIAVEVDGKTVVQWDDPEKPLGAGRIGFRTMQGIDVVTYDNLKVWEVIPKAADKGK